MSCARWLVGFSVMLGILGGCDFGRDGSPGNPPPVFQAQSFHGTEDSTLEGQLIAADPGDTLTFQVDSPPTHGVLSRFSGSGSFLYQPDADFNGTDSFVVRVVDSARGNSVAVVRLTVASANDAPVAVDDVLSVSDATSLDVLANDSDQDGDALTVELLGDPFVGSASITPPNKVNVQLPPGFKGLTKFRYRIRDMAGSASDATAIVFVGVDPFKVVYMNPDGIFINDLLTIQRASAPAATPVSRIQDMRVASGGRAIAYLSNDGNVSQLFYVNLDRPGEARALVRAANSEATRISGYQISPNGRYVIFEYADASAGGPRTATMLFDAISDGPPLQLGSPVISSLSMETQAVFNSTGTRVYHLAAAPPGTRGYHAIFRTEVATGASTRVSPVNADIEAVGGFWVAENESRIVKLVRQRAVGAFLYSQARLIDPSRPDEDINLTADFSSRRVGEPPTLSPDGSHVFFAITLDGTVIALRIANTTPPVIAAPIETPGCPPLCYPVDYLAHAEVNGLNAGFMMRDDSRAMLLATNFNIYEVPFDNPQTPVMVNAPASAGESNTAARYGPDGEYIFYIRRVSPAPSQVLAATPRVAFGTTQSLTAPPDRVAAYQLDRHGRVALIVLDGNTESPYALVNADIPLTYLPVAAPGATASDPVVLVAR